MLRSNKFFYSAIVLAVCLTILLATFIIANGNFYIKNLGTSFEDKGRIVNSISVNGEGKVFVKPDMMSFNINISELAQTSQQALTNANNKINTIINSLVSNGVDANDIQTSGINISTEYDYSGNTRVVTGQRANLSLSVKVKGIGDSAEKAATVIDSVAPISNIEISGIVFDIENKDSAFEDARELAFVNARNKATQLAGVGGVRLLSPVSISEYTYSSPEVSYRATPEMMTVSDSAGSTQIQSGQLEIVIYVDVLFGIE